MTVPLVLLLVGGLLVYLAVSGRGPGDVVAAAFKPKGSAS